MKFGATKPVTGLPDQPRSGGAFLGANEFRLGTGPRLLAFLIYATLLNRDPTPAELSAAVAALTNAGEAQRIAVPEPDPDST